MLDHKISQTELIFFKPSKSDWEDIFQRCTEIAEDFRIVRYPTKAEREGAWQKFLGLRNKAFEIRNRLFKERSKEHHRELMGQLNAADFDPLGNFIFGKILSMGFLETTVEEMKQKGRDLRAAAAHFKAVKHEMSREHKVEVHERLIEVQEHHDRFWGNYRIHKEEKSKLWAEKQQAWAEKQQAWVEKQEKSRAIKASIESNLANNREKLYKAQNALNNFESKRDALQDKIDESTSSNRISKAEGWLDEFNEKISSIEEQIERYQLWIAEGEEKLRGWN